MKNVFRYSMAVLWFSSALLVAQDTASITGAVTDSSGAAVANANVVISNAERGIKRVAPTNGEGAYTFAALPNGAYDLTVTAQGFKRYQAQGVILRVGQNARNDVRLDIGAETVEITVKGSDVAQVQTQSSEVAGTITSQEISQLQLNGRVFTQLVTLTPGVSNQTGSSEGQYGITANVNYSVNGGRLEYNNWELDGGDNMDNGSNATLNVTPSIDAIGEVRVLTSNYGAQYGRNSGGTIETETKSRTSQFHGPVYSFVRNNAFNATPAFQSQVPAYHKNDWGYTIGGPVFIPNHYNTDKKKTFFFFSQEWRRDRVPGQNFFTPVPSAAERTGDFSDVCPGPDCPTDPRTGNPFDGSLGPLPTDPNATALLGMIPSPSPGFTNIFQAAPSQPTNWREELIRVDHNINDKWQVMFRYVHDSWDTISPTPLWTSIGSFPTVQTNFVGPAESLAARLTTTVSPTLLNEFVFSYTTDHIVLTSTGTPDPNAWKRTASYTAGSLFPNAPNGGKLPGFSVSGGNGGVYGDGFGQDPGYIPNGPYNSNPTYTYRDNVTKALGNHNLQFGAYAVFAQKNELSATEPSTPGFLTFDHNSPVSSGNPFADMLLGNIASFGQASSQPKYYNRYRILEPYLQDDFRVSRKLTLNLGVRISLFGTYREKDKNAYNFDPSKWVAANAPAVDDFNGDITGQAGAIIPNTGDPFNGMVHCATGGIPTGCMSGHLFNAAPRIGFAFDPHGNGKMAIRGGYGIFYEHTNGNEANTEALEGAPPLVNTPTQFNIQGYDAIGAQAGLLFPLNVISIPSKAVWPYVQQWHLDVQREVFRNTVASVSYVGSKGTHLGRKYELNQLHSLPASQNPYIALNAPIDANNDCGSISESMNGNQVLVSGAVSGQAASPAVATHLAIACGNDANPFRPFLGYGDITRLDNGASSSYNALQMQLRRTVGTLQMNVAYTYSHSIDGASDGGLFGDGGILDGFNPSLFRASSNFDQRHTISASWIYELPFLKKPGLAHRLAGGWQVSGIAGWQTGTPFSVYNVAGTPDNGGLGNGVASSAGAGQSYADVISDPHQNVPSLSSPNGFGPFVANPNAFTQPIGLTLGDSGRNLLRNPSHWNIDMALFKRFAITERVAFEFRAEAFNIFNHVAYGPLGGDQGGAAGSSGFTSGTGSFGAGNFLQTGVAYSPRILQLGAKLVF